MMFFPLYFGLLSYQSKKSGTTSVKTTNEQRKYNNTSCFKGRVNYFLLDCKLISQHELEWFSPYIEEQILYHLKILYSSQPTNKNQIDKTEKYKN